jgi:hypothetical protein
MSGRRRMIGRRTRRSWRRTKCRERKRREGEGRERE